MAEKKGQQAFAEGRAVAVKKQKIVEIRSAAGGDTISKENIKINLYKLNR